jgi:hypothetical protein
VQRILSDHNARAKDINNPDELTRDTLLPGSTGCAVCLTRVTSADKID